MYRLAHQAILHSSLLSFFSFLFFLIEVSIFFSSVIIFLMVDLIVVCSFSYKNFILFIKYVSRVSQVRVFSTDLIREFIYTRLCIC